MQSNSDSKPEYSELTRPETQAHAPFYLGLDIGTGKVAAVILDSALESRAVKSIPHDAVCPAPQGRALQDPEVLLETVWSAVRALPANARSRIAAIGVTGQMHGVALFSEEMKALTPLVTWQDRRVLENNYLELLVEKAGHPLYSGQGAATLAWFRDHGQWPDPVHTAATIQDAAVALLTGASKPVTDPTDAAGWGLYCLESAEWDVEAWERIGVPRSILPRILACGSKAGSLCPELAGRLGLGAGTPVAAALGDHQASLVAVVRSESEDLALNIGTGAQLSAVVTHASFEAPPASFEWRPYLGNRRVATAAALCGGSAWVWLAESVESWLIELGLEPPPREKLFQRLNELGLDAVSELDLSPHFLGERHDPGLRGGIRGIGMDNFRLGSLSRSLARAIMANLKSMMPGEVLHGRRHLLGSGNALRRNPLLQKMAEGVFGLPLRLSSRQEEAACGAAINAMTLIRSGNRR